MSQAESRRSDVSYQAALQQQEGVIRGLENRLRDMEGLMDKEMEHVTAGLAVVAQQQTIQAEGLQSLAEQLTATTKTLQSLLESGSTSSSSHPEQRQGAAALRREEIEAVAAELSEMRQEQRASAAAIEHLQAQNNALLAGRRDMVDRSSLDDGDGE